MNQKDKPDLIVNYRDPEVFVALKRVCGYLLNSVWETEALGNGEAEVEFNLAVTRSKRHEREVKILANLDTDLGWGQSKRRTKAGQWVTTTGHNLNPWYEGELSLRELLDSFDDIADIISSEEPHYISGSEFLHFYHFLRSKLEKNTPKPAAINVSTLHPLIQEYCTGLFHSRHYSDAILTAYKVVFNQIKVISGVNDLDGKKLVEKAFSLENPIIKLNPLENQSDKDEQQGFMLLFSGAAVGIRNPKAHDLVVQTDKLKTLSYLAFASLLLERLDDRIVP